MMRHSTSQHHDVHQHTDHWFHPVLWLVVLIITMFMASCGRNDDAKTFVPAEVTTRLAQSFVEGFDYLAYHIEAERFDPVEQVLRNVRVEGEDGLLHADRMKVVLDTNAKTMTLELFNLHVASFGEEDDSDDGKLVTYDRYVIEPPVSYEPYLKR